MNWLLYPYQHYAEFEGRTSRREYWMSYLFIIIAMLILGALIGVSAVLGLKPLIYLFGGIFVIWMLASIVPYLAMHVRRFHDQDKSGWYYLLAFVPYVGGIIVLVFMCLPGTVGPNRFGPDPKQGDLSGVFS